MEIKVFEGENEKEILENFANFIKNNLKVEKIAGYDLDIELLLFKLIKYDIEGFKFFSLYNDYIVDLKKILGNNYYLKEYLDAFNINNDNRIDNILELFKKTLKYFNEYYEIKNYLVIDIEVERESLDIIKLKKLDYLRKKYKKNSIIEKHYNDFIENELKTGIYFEKNKPNKFFSKIKKISIAWEEE